MSWDLELDPASGDLIFAGNRDLATIDGDRLDQQRIGIRLRISRDSFPYDEDGSLGSRLRSALRFGVERARAEIPNMVMEALEPMHDIRIVNVDVAVEKDDSRHLAIVIGYMKTLSVVDADEAEDDPEELTVIVPISGGGM